MGDGIAVTRREVLAGMAAGSGVVVAGLVPGALADTHEDDLSATRERWRLLRGRYLDGESASSQAGLHRLLNGLRGDDVLSGDDQELVGGLVDALFTSDGRQAIVQWFEDSYDALAEGASATGRSMVDFIKVHVDELGDRFDRERAIQALVLVLHAAAVAPVVGNPVAALVAVTAVALIFWPE